METTPPKLLHGTLRARIVEIDKLHTGCGFNLRGQSPLTAGPQKMGKRLLSQFSKMVLCRPEIVGSRLYATVDFDKVRVARTRMLDGKTSPPRWDEYFRIYCAHMVSKVIFTVKNDDPVGATLIGRASLSVENILKGHFVGSIPIMDEDGKPISGHSEIKVELAFVDVTQDPNWSRGISPSFKGLHSFFNQRQGCRVTLYQDAHVLDSFPTRYIYPHKCWQDIFDAINNAQHFIYIAGWSVYTRITLTRDQTREQPQEDDNTLGELLKRRADGGKVRVLTLVWDDRTSVKVLKEDGLMATHDEDTADFFRDTRVKCVLCPRMADTEYSKAQEFQISAMFTHHQKTVIVDAGDEAGKRRVVSFVGGIDLCDGRYDTPQHSLFRTLNTVHSQDFHQPNFRGSSIEKGGPREPWHDIHCKLEGPVAWDVLYNFEQRWKKQGGDDLKKKQGGDDSKKKQVGDNSLFEVEELRKIIGFPSSYEDTETWNVQIFRSIDSGSVEGFRPIQVELSRPIQVELSQCTQTEVRPFDVGLTSEKDIVFDQSIQEAYINAIRRAKDFIYIENQYFLGSSYGWDSDKSGLDVGAFHLIPKELSLKIVSKIEKGERFTVYVVIPMWPEGIPESGSVQAILHWQKRTMEMMYKDIASALQAKGSQSPPNLREYLTFFCLGNLETKNAEEYAPTGTPEPDSDYSKAQQSRRFMIYVHAKMMIVDDEYIIIGSANINQRSMDGKRDTEIAMGGYQPSHLAASGAAASGQIYRFRMGLWHEHLGLGGVLPGCCQHPGSLECVQQVNAIADKNWKQYSSGDSSTDLPGHLLTYPVEISDTGSVSHLQNFEFFPDTNAPVLGKNSDTLPSILTS